MENKWGVKNNTEKLLDKSEYINKTFYKVVTSNMTFISSNEILYIKYKSGINHFDFPTQKFYFYDLNALQNILFNFEKKCIVCEIEIPEYASVWYDDSKYYYAYDIIIKNKINITEFVELNKLEETLINISRENFKFIKNPTEKMCIEAVKYNGNFLFYINNQTEEMCKIATENTWTAVKYIRDTKIKRKLKCEKYKSCSHIKLGSEYNDKIFYKIINKNMTNFNFTYTLGLNELIEDYDPFGNCTAGGFYFCELYDLKYWLKFRPHGCIYEVKLPFDALVCAQDLKYKADKIIIENPISIIEFIKLHKMEEEILKIFSLDFACDQNIIIEIIKTNGLLLEHAETEAQTLEMCVEAVKQNYMALTFVNLDFFDECLEVF